MSFVVAVIIFLGTVFLAWLTALGEDMMSYGSRASDWRVVLGVGTLVSLLVAASHWVHWWW